jgi:hypothetical protein
MSHIVSVNTYLDTIIKAYHPINVAVSAYALSLFEDYVWKAEDGQNIIQVLKRTTPTKDQSFLQRFANTIDNSNNILMVYYNLKFIN